MGAKIQAIRPLLDLRTLSAIWHFNRDFRDQHLNMFDACQTFFARAGYETVIERSWSPPPGGVLFVADHVSPLDGFAMSLACPASLKLKRTIFLVTALCLGRLVYRHNVLVWPKGSYHGLVRRTRGIIPRLMYLMTHRWGWWVRPNRALNKMCQTLAEGTCLSVLPSGEIGQRRWRSGVGAVIIELARQRFPLRQPTYFAPVYIEWRERKVIVRSPGLVSLESLFDKALHADGREEFTDWLADQYYHQSWHYDLPRSPAPETDTANARSFTQRRGDTEGNVRVVPTTIGELTMGRNARAFP